MSFALNEAEGSTFIGLSKLEHSLGFLLSGIKIETV